MNSNKSGEDMPSIDTPRSSRSISTASASGSTFKSHSIESNKREIARSKLKQFYNLDPNTPAVLKNGKNSFSSVPPDTDSYNWEKYTEKILREKKIPGLLIQSNTLDSEIRKLDSDMKTLVYENYNKFIKATDTLGEMSSYAENIEKQMASLLEKISKIYKDGKTIDDSLQPGRAKIQGLNKELELKIKIKSLTELPEKLHFSVMNGNYDMALEIWSQISQALEYKDDSVNSSEFESFKINLESAKKSTLEILSIRWEDLGITVSDAIGCSKLLVGISPERIRELCKQYLKFQSQRLIKLLEEWPNDIKNSYLVSEYNSNFLSCWNDFIFGFSSSFLSPEKAKFFEENLNYPSTKTADVDPIYFPRISIPDNDVPLAQKQLLQSCEVLVSKYESRLLKYLLEAWDVALSPDDTLERLDNFINSSMRYPLLLKFSSLKSCIGRVIRLSYEQLLGRVFLKIIFDLFIKISNYFSMARFNPDNSSETIFHGNIPRMDALLNFSHSRVEMQEFLLQEQNSIIVRLQKNLVPLIQKTFNHYSKSEFSATDSLNPKDKPVSGTISNSDLKKIFITMLNSQLDKFHREYIPAAIGFSLGVDTELEKRRIGTNNSNSRLNFFERISKTVSKIKSPAALIFFSRFCLDMDKFLVKVIYVLCENSLKACETLLSAETPNGLNLPNISNYQLTENDSPSFDNDQVEALIKESFEFDDFIHLQFNKDSLALLMHRIAELLVLAFIKAIGNDLVTLYNLMLPSALGTLKIPSENRNPGVFGDWIINNANFVKNLGFSDQILDSNLESLSKNQNLDELSDHPVSIGALIIRKWFEIIEGILMSLFFDQIFLDTVLKHKSDLTNIISERMTKNFEDGLNPVDLDVENNIKSPHGQNKNRSAVINARRSSVNSFSISGDSFDPNFSILKYITHPSKSSFNRTNSNLTSADSLLLSKIDKLFAEKTEYYPSKISDFSASNILYLLSIIYVKGSVEFWRGQFFISGVDKNEIPSTVVINRKQLFQLQLDLTFVKIFMSDYSESAAVKSQLYSSNLGNNKRTSTGLANRSIKNGLINSNGRDFGNKSSRMRDLESSYPIKNIGIKSLKSPHALPLSKSQSSQIGQSQKRLNSTTNTVISRGLGPYINSPNSNKSPLGIIDDSLPHGSNNPPINSSLLTTSRTRSINNANLSSRNPQNSSSSKSNLLTSNKNKIMSPRMEYSQIQTQTQTPINNRLNSLSQNFESINSIGGHPMSKNFSSSTGNSIPNVGCDSTFGKTEGPLLSLVNELEISISNRCSENLLGTPSETEDLLVNTSNIEIVAIKTYLETVHFD
ncbi:Vacuolar protein sorting-associated protein 51-like protein [Smittium mucronatum]|uniref:Vacuolar protein sorting-associated protein 51-like protein n=1 Tax=Smittium mucronatum TaxID=133383 RepID=A0A1R0GTF4_9FUNG|nr:Vacuolar protein sorting-associated protein 51-like protein [Smittium mucronatum]